MSCDVGEVTERLENEQILQPFRLFTYATTHSTLPSFCLRHSSLSNPSVAYPTSQFILQPFFRFSYVTSSSLNSPGEPPVPRSILCSISIACDLSAGLKCLYSEPLDLLSIYYRRRRGVVSRDYNRDELRYGPNQMVIKN